MKIFLLTGLLFYCTSVFAQQNKTAARVKALSHVNPALLKMKAHVSAANRNIDNRTIPYNNNLSRRLAAPATAQSFPNEYIIGNTYYDLQTNNTISNRLVNNADGTMSAVWTFADSLIANFPNRGTGYNYFNGSSWGPIPTQTIETGENSVRAGFPNIGVTSAGREVVIAHSTQVTGPSQGMLFTSRPHKGTGSWNVNDTLLGKPPLDSVNLWPKMVVGGSDGLTIHAIWRGGSANGVIDGQAGPIFYSRSTDGGFTWDTLETILTPLDSTYYYSFSGDEYSIDAKDSVVAIVAGSMGTDVVLVKSTDNGVTWTKTVIDRFPIPLYNIETMTTDTVYPYTGTADTLWTGSGDANLVIDNNGKVHVFFTIMQFLVDSVGTSEFENYPYTSQLFYWNEGMGADSSAFLAYAPGLIPDQLITNIAQDQANCPKDFFQFGTYGPTRVIEMPSAGVDANNNIYVCYQTVDINSDIGTAQDNDDKLFKHPYLLKSTDGGNTWPSSDSAYDVLRATQGGGSDFDEGVYACMAKRVDSLVHIIYQRDQYPGIALETVGDNIVGCEAQLNSNNNLSEIIYVGLDTSVSLLNLAVHELPASGHGVAVSDNFPNPATTSTQFNVTLSTALNVNVNVSDMLGQRVYAENKGELAPGMHTVTLNTSYLSAGVYFYTVTAGDEQITGKMVVK